jgi:3',5'-cyclic AMP phosphodiesterase CpdA
LDFTVTTVRIAHFSDTHVLSLEGVGPKRFLNKRWTGAVNLALNRSRHYRVDIFERLLKAVTAAEPDHSVCTGDLVNLALEPEFVRVSEMLQATFEPEDLTLIPGNHDYYVKEAVDSRLFETFFGRYQTYDLGPQSASGYPVARLLDEVAIVGLNSAIPTPVFLATGTVGEAQLNAFEEVMDDERIGDRFRLMLIHHPLLPEPNRRLDSARKLLDADQVIASLNSLQAKGPDLIVHGHNHEFKRMAVPGCGTPIIQVGSASRAGSKHVAEFNVYVIEDKELKAVERHMHDPSTHEFVRSDEFGRPIL